jgi:hypothetical protein
MIAGAASADERLVIPLSVPRRVDAAFAGLSIVFVVGSAVWISVSPSWKSIVYGGGMIGAFAWVWATRLVVRRVGRTAPLQIVATSHGLSSPFWSIDWDRVARMWIGPTKAGRLMALNIEPMRAEDVNWIQSKTLRLNARVGDAMNMPAIQILQINVDRPLDELDAQLRSIAGRSFNAE